MLSNWQSNLAVEQLPLNSGYQDGEWVVEQRNITQGYENNPQANETAFTHGWFRTGD